MTASQKGALIDALTGAMGEDLGGYMMLHVSKHRYNVVTQKKDKYKKKCEYILMSYVSM